MILCHNSLLLMSTLLINSLSFDLFLWIYHCNEHYRRLWKEHEENRCGKGRVNLRWFLVGC